MLTQKFRSTTGSPTKSPTSHNYVSNNGFPDKFFRHINSHRHSHQDKIDWDESIKVKQVKHGAEYVKRNPAPTGLTILKDFKTSKQSILDIYSSKYGEQIKCYLDNFK